MIESKPLPFVLPALPVSSTAPRPKRRLAALRSQHPFFLRLLAGSLAVSIPVMLGLSIGLTYLSSQRIIDAATIESANPESTAAAHVANLRTLPP